MSGHNANSFFRNKTMDINSPSPELAPFRSPLSRRRTPKHSHSESRVTDLSPLKPERSLSGGLGSLTRLHGLRSPSQPPDYHAVDIPEEDDEYSTPKVSSLFHERSDFSPMTVLHALDKIHTTNMDGVDVLYSNISKEVQSTRDEVVEIKLATFENNRKSVIRQFFVAAVVTTINIIFNIFVFPHLAPRCKMMSE